MRLSDCRWDRHRLAPLMAAWLLMAASTTAFAQDDWRHKGLDALRPVRNGHPTVAFMQNESPQTTTPVAPLVDQPTDEPLQPLPVPESPDSYGDWLDQSSYKRIPLVREGRLVLPTLEAPTIATDQIGNGRTPEGFRSDKPAPIRPLPETSGFRGAVSWTPAYWAAANTFSNTRYFEDRMLERHGHEICPSMTPILSGVRFYGQIAMLPYLMTISPPCDCESTLGYFRSGTCAPGLKQRPPWECRAALVEAASVAGFVLLIP